VPITQSERAEIEAAYAAKSPASAPTHHGPTPKTDPPEPSQPAWRCSSRPPADPRRGVSGRRYAGPMELLALLFAVGFAVKFWFIIAAIIGLVVAAHWVRCAVDRHIGRVNAERHRVAGLRDRADAQHRQFMAGDERGVYGEYPAAPV
jgi:hypothetical protein